MDAAVPQRMLGHYRLLEQIGAGAMGIVFRAYDERLDRDVAVKILPPGLLADHAARERFRREARILSKLSHPHIAAVHDFDTQEDTDFLVMELIAGQSLMELLQKGPVSTPEVIRIGLQLAEGLAAAHAKGIVHRDLKPSNIRLDADGRLKILDFGLARILPLSPAADTLTADEISGTLPYMAPEQLKGEAWDVRSDIYSAGVVLYELVTARHLFPLSGAANLISDILNRVPVRPSEINPEVTPACESIILRALEKAPERRQQSAQELFQELSRAHSSPASPAVQVRPSRVRKWLGSLRRHPYLPVAVAVATAAALIFWLARPQSALSFVPREPVVLADFDNRTGEKVFDRSISSALAISLEQSSYARVYSRSQMRETLKRMRKADAENIDDALAREIAQREGIRFLVAPQISGIGGEYRLAAIIQDATSGESLRTVAVKVQSQDGVLEGVDALAEKIRRQLGESRNSISKTSKPLVQVTTHSLEALRQYSIGVDKQRALDVDAAKKFYENALRTDPGFTAARASLGKLHIDQAGLERPGFDATQGERLLREAVTKVDDLTDRERLGILAFYAQAIEKDFGKAVGYQQALLSIYPDFAAGHLNLGVTYRSMRRIPEAIAEFKQAIELDPKFMMAYANLGGTYLYVTGEMGPALEICKKLAANFEQNLWAQDCVGWASLGKDELKQAEAAYQKALAINPHYALGRYRLAHVFRLQRRPADAVTVLLPFLRQAPLDLSAHYDIGVDYSLAGDVAAGRRHLQAFKKLTEEKIRKEPQNWDRYIELGAVLTRLGNTQAGLEAATKGFQRNPTLHFDLATVLAMQGKGSEACAHLQSAIENGFTNFVWLKIHPDFDPVHDEPCFRLLLARVLKN